LITKQGNGKSSAMPRLVRPLHHEGFSKGRQQQKVKVKSLLCFWAVIELGMSLIDLARELELSIPGVGYAVEKGETIVQDNKYQLIG